jgi:polyisoprenoid-binding protein YceI
MKKLALFCAVLSLAPLSARAENYLIEPANSRIAFSVHHLIGTARGEFHKFSGTIVVDPNQPERSSVNVKIQVASIDTQIRKRDDHLLSAEFFDAKQFPEITFRSRSVKRTGPDRGDIVGELTMHGVTRPLTLHVKLATPLASGAPPEKSRWIVTADPIHRKDFGLMFSSSAEAVSGIGQDVTPTIEIEARRAD